MNLQPGFYWIKYTRIDRWEIAEWTGKSWWVIGDSFYYSGHPFFLIGDRVEEPKEDGIK